MQYVVLAMIFSVVTFEFLDRAHLVPSVAAYLPEVLAAFTLLYVATAGVRGRFSRLSPINLMLFAGIAFVMICGIVLNHVEPGPVFAGIRNYCRVIPFFLLPAVYHFSDKEIAVQLRLLFALCLLQLPLSAYQKMQPYVTGDAVHGTLMISSVLSMFLICAACIVIGFYLRGRIRLPMLILILILILFPATINETKGTLILLPIAITITFILGARTGTRLRNTLVATGILVASLSAFIAIYDYTQKDKPYHVGIIEFFAGDSVSTYMESGKGFTTESEEIRRVDQIKLIYRYLSTDPVRIAFGVGMGNASRSSLGPTFQGKYAPVLVYYTSLTATRLFAEIGVLGLALVLALKFSLFMDAYTVARLDKGMLNAVAAGWLGIVAVIVLGMFYKDIIPANSLSFLFWYLSGLIAARRMALAQEAVALRSSSHGPQAVAA